MAINLADKYAKKIAEKFYVDSVILGKSSTAYDWDGVKTVKVWTITTVAPGNYTRTGTSRYGTPTEVQDTYQVMDVLQDKSVALTVDKGNNTQQMLIKNAGKVVALELREQFVPMFDKYCLARWSGLMSTAPSWATYVQTHVDASLTKSNIVETIFAGVTALRNKGAKINDAYCYIGETNFAKLLLSPEFLNVDKLGERNVENGVLGKVRGIQVVPVPDDYFDHTVNTDLTKDINFMIVKKECVLAPTQIKDIRIHQDPPGINGGLMEIRWLYDAFALDTKAEGIYVSTTS